MHVRGQLARFLLTSHESSLSIVPNLNDLKFLLISFLYSIFIFISSYKWKIIYNNLFFILKLDQNFLLLTQANGTFEG